MKRLSTFAAIAIFAWTAAANAQTSSTDTGSRRAAPSPQRTTARNTQTARQTAEEITVTGCLQANQESASAASSANTRATRRAQTNQFPSFVLNNASQPSGTAAAEASTSQSEGNRSVGTSGTTNPPATGSLAGRSQLTSGGGAYILQGLDLTPQVGQQVEVTGMIVPASNARRRNARASQPSSEANASMQRIRVTSARMIAPRCGNQ